MDKFCDLMAKHLSDQPHDPSRLNKVETMNEKYLSKTTKKYHRLLSLRRVDGGSGSTFCLTNTSSETHTHTPIANTISTSERNFISRDQSIITIFGKVIYYNLFQRPLKPLSLPYAFSL